MLPMKTSLFRQTFKALSHRNFKIFWSGQFISLIGTWMQSIAQGWLVYRLTNSPFMLGLVSSMTFLPVFFLSFVGGAVADRIERRKILIFTQASSMILALLLGILTSSGLIRIWHIIIIAGCFGLINSFDAPARQSFVVDLVGKEDLRNAIALNSSIFNSARIIGPAIGGVLISLFGEAFCFYINAVSYIAVLTGLNLIKPDNNLSNGPDSSFKKGLIEGFKYIRENKVIFFLLLMVGITSIFGMTFTVLMPIFAKSILKVGAKGLGYLMATAGFGSVFGALKMASGGTRTRLKTILLGGLAGSSFLVFFAFSKWFFLSLFFLFFVGLGMIMQIAMTNTFIQEIVPDHLRGRVMSVFTFMLLGMSPIGNFIAGGSAHLIGTPLTVGIGGFICLLSVIILGKMARAASSLQEKVTTK
ncbi:MAG: hypothetical protein A2042_00635 [Candidatus Schekmanbacteria bacterium GWA2_38_11]|uniref:Major facilitator superfamily (MFS) profile domain-containing protein n=1 Tax=Candidatus Schekmanbacteria bacterium GWA2_38_11 TaxID=1817876 RepID=A0A1F7RKV1_9BACT|nr:MAG: hypothetical protein A2042_00635 [Candidatus Schekmanbacteria bacterium GWA2_38_11]